MEFQKQGLVQDPAHPVSAKPVSWRLTREVGAPRSVESLLHVPSCPQGGKHALKKFGPWAGPCIELLHLGSDSICPAGAAKLVR